jgi:hypothetical protein
MKTLNTIWMAALLAGTFALTKVDALSADTEEKVHHDTANHSTHHLNTMELFIGYTSEDGEHGSESGGSIGIVYERRLSSLFGTGGFLEFTSGDLEKWSVGIPLFIHPYKQFRFNLTPGLERRHGKDKFLFRTGVAYEFELPENWVIAPEFNLDFVDGQEAYVFGISVGVGF